MTLLRLVLSVTIVRCGLVPCLYYDESGNGDFYGNFVQEKFCQPDLIMGSSVPERTCAGHVEFTTHSLIFRGSVYFTVGATFFLLPSLINSFILNIEMAFLISRLPASNFFIHFFPSQALPSHRPLSTYQSSASRVLPFSNSMPALEKPMQGVFHSTRVRRVISDWFDATEPAVLLVSPSGCLVCT